MATSRTWVASRGIAAIGTRRLRQAGDRADVGEPDAAGRLIRGRLLRRWPTARVTSPGSKRPAAATTSSGPASSRGGSRYHAERSTAGCCVPLRQLPITGVVAGSRP